MFSEYLFNKYDLNKYFNELSKIYKTIDNTPLEIILVGGASVLINYNFRKSTNDADALIPSSKAIKKAIKLTAKMFNLDNDWLNMEFKKSSSYSDELKNIAEDYKTFNDVIKVKTVNDKYLVAMKLKSGRLYKNDLSDVIGIIAEHIENKNPITLELIKDASKTLYGDYENISYESRMFFENVILKCKDYKKLYLNTKNEEMQNLDIFNKVKKENPERLVAIGINNVIKEVKNKISINNSLIE